MTGQNQFNVCIPLRFPTILRKSHEGICNQAGDSMASRYSTGGFSNSVAVFHFVYRSGSKGLVIVFSCMKAFVPHGLSIKSNEKMDALHIGVYGNVEQISVLLSV